MRGIVLSRGFTVAVAVVLVSLTLLFVFPQSDLLVRGAMVVALWLMWLAFRRAQRRWSHGIDVQSTESSASASS